MTFKDRVKELRNEAGLSAIDLANKLVKSESAIRMWESGKSKPDIDTLAELSRFFGCTTDYLLGISDVRSLETKVRAVCDYTGLTESAVELLNEWQGINNNGMLETVSLLIEHSKWPPDEGQYYHYYSSQGGEDSYDEAGYTKALSEWEQNGYVDFLTSLSDYLKTSTEHDTEILIKDDGTLEPAPPKEERSPFYMFRAIKSLTQNEIVENVLFLSVQEKLRELKRKLEKDGGTSAT